VKEARKNVPASVHARLLARAQERREDFNLTPLQRYTAERFLYRLGASPHLGDAIEPPARDEEYPVLLDGPSPRIRAYGREAVVAEKLNAMVVLGAANSRYKDFYDVLVLATHFSFSGVVLARAIAATFARRHTPLTQVQPLALTPGIYSAPERAAEWQRYLFRARLPGALADFVLVGEQLQAFLVHSGLPSLTPARSPTVGPRRDPGQPPRRSGWSTRQCREAAAMTTPPPRRRSATSCTSTTCAPSADYRGLPGECYF